MAKRYISMTMIMSLFLQLAGATILSLILAFPTATEAAACSLDPTPNTSAVGHTVTGSSLVFIDENVGYKFHRFGVAPDSGKCVYRKTTDGGATWGAQVVVDSQTDCSNVVVWYDQWTPGDNGTYIHIATYDTGDDELFYNRLDTSDDSLLLVTATSTTLGSTATYGAGTNLVSITKATDGVVYMVADDAQGTEIVSCASNCDLSTSWLDVGAPPQGNADSWSTLMPLPAGEVLLINQVPVTYFAPVFGTGLPGQLLILLMLRLFGILCMMSVCRRLLLLQQVMFIWLTLQIMMILLLLTTIFVQLFFPQVHGPQRLIF